MSKLGLLTRLNEAVTVPPSGLEVQGTATPSRGVQTQPGAAAGSGPVKCVKVQEAFAPCHMPLIFILRTESYFDIGHVH